MYEDQREAGGLENKNYLAPLNTLRQPAMLQNKNTFVFWHPGVTSVIYCMYWMLEHTPEEEKMHSVQQG